MWLGLGAAAQVGVVGIYLAEHLAGSPELSRALGVYAATLLCATVALYGGHRLIGWGRLPPGVRQAPRWVAVGRLAHVLRGVVPLAGLAAAAGAASLPWSWQWRAAAPALVGLAYVVPSYRGRRLRDFGALKVIWLTVGWVGLTSWVPLGAVGATVPWWRPEDTYLFCLERAAFMLGHSLAFDARDVVQDREEGVNTIPLRIGWQWTRRLSLVLLAISALGVVYVPLPRLCEGLAVASLGLVSLVAIPLVWSATSRVPAGHLTYGFALDGLFLLPLVVAVMNAAAWLVWL